MINPDDIQNLKYRVRDLEKRYDHNHKADSKPWYLSVSSWIAILCFLLLVYILYIFYMSEMYGNRVYIPYLGEF